MTAFIIEDEHLGLERLLKLLQEADPEMEVLGHADSIRNAVSWLRSNTAPDLIFMDIELADGQCFEIFHQVDVPSPIIFTTSYDEYALHAFKVNSVDYLLKPIKKEELVRALDKYRLMKRQFGRESERLDVESLIHSLSGFRQQKEYRKRFLVKQGQRLLSVETSETAYFVADGKLCFLRTWDNQRYLVDYNLEQLSAMLDPADFFRINRSYLVHIRSIRSINNYFNGKLILQLTPSTEQSDTTVSKEKAMAFKQWMGK